MSTGWRMVIVAVAISMGSAARTTSAADDPASPAPQNPADHAPAESPPPPKYVLAFKFEPNQITRYEVEQKSEIRTHAKDETETVKNTSKARRHFKVLAVDEKTGEADLELWIDWVHMVASFDNPARTKTDPIEFQSDDPQKHPPQFADVLNTVGRPRATIRFTPTGKIVKILVGAPVEAPAAAGQLKQGPAAPPLDDGSPESFFIPLPEQPVAVGESWRDRFDVVLRDDTKNHFKITIQRVYRLAGIENDRARIEFHTAILTSIPNPSIGGQLIQRELSGKVVFDMARGLIVSRESGVENTVVGPFGPRSSMQAKSHHHEHLHVDEPLAQAPSSAETTGADTGRSVP